MNSPVSFLTILRQNRLQRSEMFSWNKIINALKRSWGNLNHRVENVIKQLVHTLAVRSSRYEALGKFGEHSTPRATLTHLSCSPNFPRASYLDERTLTHVNYWALYFSAGRLETVIFFSEFWRARKGCHTAKLLYQLNLYFLHSTWRGINTWTSA